VNNILNYTYLDGLYELCLIGLYKARKHDFKNRISLNGYLSFKYGD